MPTKSDKYSSDYLPTEQMQVALLALPDVLQLLRAEHQIIASYGWGAKIHPDLWYKPMKENTKWLQYLIEDSIEQRIVIPGESDFSFNVPDGRLEVTFCHDSDIHLNGSEDKISQRFMSTKPFSDMHWNTREIVEKSMSE
jgi:hypothetical protein